MKIDATEWDGGFIHKECPCCGQFCKVPENYYCYPKGGCWAESYCKRCKKKVYLNVEFI